jgi:hypothetical protein
MTPVTTEKKHQRVKQKKHNGSNCCPTCKAESKLVTETGEVIPPELGPFIRVLHKDGDKFVVPTREFELAKVRKNGGKLLLGEIMIETGQFVIGDPCFTERLPYDKVLDVTLDKSLSLGDSGEVFVPRCTDTETGRERVGGTVVLSRTGIGDGIFPIYAHYKDGELTEVVIELNHGRWFTREDEQHQLQQDAEVKPAA